MPELETGLQAVGSTATQRFSSCSGAQGDFVGWVVRNLGVPFVDPPEMFIVVTNVISNFRRVFPIFLSSSDKQTFFPPNKLPFT